MKPAGAGRICEDGLIDRGAGPILRYMENIYGFPQPVFTGGSKHGPGFRGRELLKWVVLVKWASGTENAFMNVVEQLKENYEEAKKLWDNYDVRLREFRSAVKNDVASLEAAARKTTEAVQKMNLAYGNVIRLMNSEEMKTATENAERLAAAMSVLANLQSHKLSIAVIDNSPNAQDSPR